MKNTLLFVFFNFMLYVKRYARYNIYLKYGFVFHLSVERFIPFISSHITAFSLDFFLDFLTHRYL